MQKYFISDSDFENKMITSDDVFHIKNVMRSKVGDEILIGNNSKCYLAKITKINNKDVLFEIEEEKIGNTELPVFVTLFQGYPKVDKMADIIKHSTELGVYEIVPTIMKRSLFKLNEDKRDNKLIRFNKIAKEAAEQSYRMIVPKVLDIVNLKKIDFSKYDKKILCFEEDAKDGKLKGLSSVVTNLNKGDKVAILIGPEGGIDMEEYEYLTSLGFISCALGKRILRTETASFYALSAISYELEVR